MTLAPVAKIFRTRSRVISDSLAYQLIPNDQGQASLPPSDSLELLGVIDGDVDTEVHPLLSQVDIQTSNLGPSDSCLHSYHISIDRSFLAGMTHPDWQQYSSKRNL
jgi:hypothetical protein